MLYSSFLGKQALRWICVQVVNWGVVLGTALTRNYATQDWTKGEVNWDAAAAEASVDPMVCSEAGRAFKVVPS